MFVKNIFLVHELGDEIEPELEPVYPRWLLIYKSYGRENVFFPRANVQMKISKSVKTTGRKIS